MSTRRTSGRSAAVESVGRTPAVCESTAVTDRVDGTTTDPIARSSRRGRPSHLRQRLETARARIPTIWFALSTMLGEAAASTILRRISWFTPAPWRRCRKVGEGLASSSSRLRRDTLSRSTEGRGTRKLLAMSCLEVSRFTHRVAAADSRRGRRSAVSRAIPCTRRGSNPSKCPGSRRSGVRFERHCAVAAHSGEARPCSRGGPVGEGLHRDLQPRCEFGCAQPRFIVGLRRALGDVPPVRARV